MTPLNYRWAHAVNSNALLNVVQRQIQDAAKLHFVTPDFVNAIEADIIYSEIQQIPVMGHPPAIDGDLALSQFLPAMLELAATFQHSDISAKTPLIVKLDFKSSRAFEASLELLAAFVEKYPFTEGIFINADILPGPVSTNFVAFDATLFLQQVDQLGDRKDGQHRHKLVLSVGWTTANTNDEEIYRAYSPEMVNAMLNVLRPYRDKFAVTFPLRATSVRKSWSALRPLLRSPNYGFTLWWATTQLPDDELEWIYTTLEHSTCSETSTKSDEVYANRTFYDIKGFASFLARRE